MGFYRPLFIENKLKQFAGIIPINNKKRVIKRLFIKYDFANWHLFKPKIV